MTLQLRHHAAIILCCLALHACSDDSSSNDAAKKSAGHLVSATVAALHEIRLEETLPGTLEAQRVVRIFNQEEGVLTRLNVREGDRVKQGELLAQLDDSLLRAELARAEANLKQAQLDLQRQENLAAQKLTSDDAVARARTAAAIAEAETDLQRTHVQHTRITAPFAGVISERLLEAGDVAPTHSHMFTLIDTRQLKARVQVSEWLLPQLALHDRVSIVVDALGAHTFSGKISRIYPAIDTGTRQGTIEIEFNPHNAEVLPGQMCRVSLQGRPISRLMIDFDAVRHDNDGAFVYVIREQQAKRVGVQTGVQQQGLIEIVQGIQAGDKVITKGFTGLHDGKPVTESKS